ncbi:peptidoglycan DD-metalloendopeptidase family protein [Microbacterium sp. NPDC019599]|uniref:peptidoglycan DD-metalloendopeptidase family protein n=1 Tax=Microbacterium sp. NPDC019599 TaxID=3154690 RepID=UPI0033E44496
MGRPFRGTRAARPASDRSWAWVVAVATSVLLVAGSITGGASTAVAAGPMPVWQLPFEAGQRWQAGSPHASSSVENAPRASLDFGPGSSGTNSRVVAMAAGTVYSITCSGGSYLGIDHGNGWRSTYYHLKNQQTGLIGKSVSVGTYLGDAGQTLPCGGSSTFNHVHVTILADGRAVSVSGFRFGDYTVYSAGQDYYGYWNNGAGARVVTNNGVAMCCLTSTTSTPTPPVPPDGTFVVYQGNVYRIAGGAPLYVSDWNAVGGVQTYRTLSDSDWAALRRHPADGTFILGGATGHVFRIAGGAPVYVSSWDAVGGAQTPVTVDQAVIDNADGAAPWNRLRTYPADGTFINGGSTGQVFRIAGGAPIYVGSWAAVGGARAVTTVDQAAIDNADGGTVWNHLRRYPADGTFINSGSTGRVFRVAGGAPIYVGSWAAVGGAKPVTTIDQAAIDNADGIAPWSNLRAHPADGTFLTVLSGEVYRTVGGSPRLLGSWDAVGGAQPSTLVDAAAVAKAGGAAPWNHLLEDPIDGSSILTKPSGKHYRFDGGFWREATASPSAVAIGDSSEYPSQVIPGVPTVTGTANVGNVLTANPGSWAPAPIAFAYQWTRDGTPISGATASKYRLATPDAGRKIAVQLTGSSTGMRSAAATSPVRTVRLAFTTAPTPTISGTAKVGSTLTAAAGTWSPTPTTLTYQWKRNGAAITGATSRTYLLAKADAGASITVTTTAGKPGYAPTSKTSAAKTIATLPFTTAPVPTISGTARVGSTLTAMAGAWSPTPTAVSYQWKRNGTAIAGATAATYLLAAADAGAGITVTVTAARSGYTTTSKTSAAKAIPLIFTAAPTPTISGTAKVGSTLTATAGVWTPTPTTLSYQWKRDGAAITGATSTTYVLVAADAGTSITVTTKAAKSGYSTTSKTSAVTVIATLAFTTAPTPTISGAATVGSTLTATAGAWSPTPTTVSYQWARGGTPITGATSATYLLVAADAGTTITVTTTAVRSGYTTTSRTSVAKAIPPG